MRVFLTGISGYLGGVLAEHFSHVGEIERITGIDVVPPKSPLPEKVRFTQMDMRSPEVSAAMAGHDAVVHTAFIVLWPAKMPAAERNDINLNGTRNVAESAVANRVQRLFTPVATRPTINTCCADRRTCPRIFPSARVIRPVTTATPKLRSNGC